MVVLLFMVRPVRSVKFVNKSVFTKCTDSPCEAVWWDDASYYWLAQGEPTSFVRGEIITCIFRPFSKEMDCCYICMALYSSFFIILEQQNESLLTFQPDIHRLQWIRMQSALSNTKCVLWSRQTCSWKLSVCQFSSVWKAQSDVIKSDLQLFCLQHMITMETLPDPAIYSLTPPT